MQIWQHPDSNIRNVRDGNTCMYFKLCEYYNLKLHHCVSMPLTTYRTVLAYSQDREDSFQMCYMELLSPVQLVLTSENNGAVVIIITHITETCEALWFVCVAIQAPENETVSKCIGNIQNWIIHMYEQREIKCKSNMRKTAYLYADCKQEVRRSERNPSNLHNSGMFLGHSEFGQYGLNTNRSQWLTHIKCLPDISQCPLASHFSRRTHYYSQNTTGLPNTTYSQNPTQHSQKILYCQQQPTKYSQSTTFSLQDITHYTQKEAATSAGSLVETITCIIIRWSIRRCNDRQIIIIRKSSTLAHSARHVRRGDTVTESVQSDYVDRQAKVDRLFNAPVSEQGYLCHPRAWTVWLNISGAILECSLSVLNVHRIVACEKLEEFCYKLVTRPNKGSVTNTYLCLRVVRSAGGVIEIYYNLEKSGAPFITVNAFLIHNSGISHAGFLISLSQTHFAKCLFCWITEATLFHVCTSGCVGSHSSSLNPGFTSAPIRLGVAREITQVRSQSQSINSYVTCRLQISYYLVIMYGLTVRFPSPDSKKTGYTWDRCGNQWIFTLLVWRNRTNRRNLFGKNFVSEQPTAHLAAESSRSYSRDTWLAKASCHNNGKYEVIAAATHCNNIQEESTVQVVSFDIFFNANLVGISHTKHEADDLRRPTHRRKCISSLRKTANPRIYIEDAVRETTTHSKCINNHLEVATNLSKWTIEEVAEATNRNNCNSEDENPTPQNHSWRRVSSRLTRDHPVLERIECDIVSTPTLLRASDRVYNLNSTVQADQQSLGLPSTSQIICVNGHQQSSFPETGHRENSWRLDSDPETPSPNLLSDVMFNAGVTERDIDELLNSDADLESFILNSDFSMDLFSELSLDDSLLTSVLEPDTVLHTLNDQMGECLTPEGNISDRLGAAGLDNVLPSLLLANEHVSFNNIPLETSQNQCYPCRALTSESDSDFTSQSENNPVSSDCYKAFDSSSSIAHTEILNNLSNTNIYDPYLMQFYSEHMTSTQARPPHGSSSQQSNCKAECMIVEESRNEGFSFGNTLEIFNENPLMQMQAATEEHGEIFTTNISSPVSNSADQRGYQTQSSSTKTAQQVESRCVDNEAKITQLQSFSLLQSVFQRECRVVIEDIYKRKITIDPTTVDHSGSRRKVPRVETPSTNSARSGRTVKARRGRQCEVTSKYNLRSRSFIPSAAD